jgi:hypothetical protein
MSFDIGGRNISFRLTGRDGEMDAEDVNPEINLPAHGSPGFLIDSRIYFHTRLLSRRCCYLDVV